MKTITLLTTLYRSRFIIQRIAKLFAWLFGIQTAILFILATGADAPLPFTSAPAVRFAIAITVFYLSPFVINALIRRIAARFL